jgi:hypothetical protein
MKPSDKSDLRPAPKFLDFPETTPPVGKPLIHRYFASLHDVSGRYPENSGSPEFLDSPSRSGSCSRTLRAGNRKVLG